MTAASPRLHHGTGRAVRFAAGTKRAAIFLCRPVGDPAMGPSAYAHRASASENPIASLGHHLQDSTHIANDVVTGGLAYKKARIEFSGFHGREPDEFRWNIDSGAVRFVVNAPHRAAGPELEYAILLCSSYESGGIARGGRRSTHTASVSYNRPLPKGKLGVHAVVGSQSSIAERADLERLSGGIYVAIC